MPYDVYATVTGTRGSIAFEPYADDVSELGVKPNSLVDIRDELIREYDAVFGSMTIRPTVAIRIVDRAVPR